MDKCPHCEGMLAPVDDGYEELAVCIACGRRYHLDGMPYAMTLDELKRRTGIKVPPVPEAA
jgi:DNA-directed RNA polymerase subunit M/transcription elongation factor TFIIS